MSVIANIESKKKCQETEAKSAWDFWRLLGLLFQGSTVPHLEVRVAEKATKVLCALVSWKEFSYKLSSI